MEKNRVRVLQVTGGLGQGGLQTVTMNIVRYMDRERFAFDFLVLGGKEGVYEQEAARLGCQIFRAEKTKDTLSYYQSIKRAIRAHGPYDVVISHTFLNSGIVLRAAKKCGVKTCVAYAHSAKRGRRGALKALSYQVLRHWINRYADIRAACSGAAGAYVFRKKKPFYVIHNGVKTSDFKYSEAARREIRQSLGLQDQYVIGNVGRLSAEKNQAFLVQVLNELIQSGRDAVLLLVGEGNEREAIEKAVRETGLQEKVILTGDRSDVPALLSAMDAFLFPSFHEGLGICAIEAQASGLPTICADTVPKEVGITELVSFKSLRDGPKAWAEEICRAGQNGNREAYCRAVAEKGYSVEACIGRLQEIIDGFQEQTR
ncbi:MAG: glycosyltransferase family 1 protein [Clostridia bacterium]|nr:glycosyltransferase family 1 protein [Clostridia bacterium]